MFAFHERGGEKVRGIDREERESDENEAVGLRADDRPRNWRDALSRHHPALFDYTRKGERAPLVCQRQVVPFDCKSVVTTIIASADKTRIVDSMKGAIRGARHRARGSRDPLAHCTVHFARRAICACRFCENCPSCQSAAGLPR